MQNGSGVAGDIIDAFVSDWRRCHRQPQQEGRSNPRTLRPYLVGQVLFEIEAVLSRGYTASSPVSRIGSMGRVGVAEPTYSQPRAQYATRFVYDRD